MTCRRTGGVTPPVPASSVEGGSTIPVIKSPGPQSPLSPPSHSDRRERPTCVGAYLGLVTRSSYLVVDTLPILLRLCLDHLALEDLSHCHTIQPMPVVSTWGTTT